MKAASGHYAKLRRVVASADWLRAGVLRTKRLRTKRLRADGLRANGLRADGLRADGLRTKRLRAVGLRAEERADRLRNVLPREGAAGLLTYVAVVTVSALAVVGLSAGELGRDVAAAEAAFWLIAVLAVGIDVLPFAAPGRRADLAIFPSISFSFALLLGWGLIPAVLVQTGAVVVASVRLRHAGWRAVFNAAQYTLSLGVAAAVLVTVDSPPLAAGATTGVAVVAAILGAAVVWFVVNDVLVSTASWLWSGGSWREQVGRSMREDALATLGLLALGPLIVAAGNFSAALVPLTLIPLFAVNELARYGREEQAKALVDELTGLPNRKALFAEMRQLARLHRARRTRDPRRMALLLLDIDQFRRVNDALGHAAGDRLLVAVAQRLRECVGADGMVARLGGDEFGVFAARLTDLSAASVLAERVADALAEPVTLDTLDTLPLDVTAAIGVAVYPEHGTDNTTILRRAEIAMYDAKDRGASYAIYTPESDHDSADRLELVAELRGALELGRRDEIVLNYQPQVDLSTHQVVGVEALLRWHHPRRGLVSPEHLIKMTEHTAVMRLLTHRVLDDAIGQLAKWRAQGLQVRASVNVSVRDLHHPELVEQLAAMLSERDVPPNQLQLEITEGALMADPRRVLVTLHRLDRLGVALSLDDFGTGYSSLQHLRRLPLAEVKIDRSFVLGMAQDPDDAAVVSSIIDLARALGLRVVAEGVEDDATRRRLVERGCEVAQGWFFARPMPADALVAWLEQYRPVPRLGEQSGTR